MTSTFPNDMPSAPHTRFRLPDLTAVQKDHFRRLADGLLEHAIEEADLVSTTFHMDHHQDNHEYWKHVRTHHGLKMYKPTRPPGGGAATSSADLMMTGIVQGSLDDVMTSVYADTSAAFQMQSALSMPKDYLDCQVLHAIDTASANATRRHEPYHFRGLKWCATSWPGGALTKPRDFCYFEATGIAQSTPSAGTNTEPTTFGYCVMESFDLAQCQSLDELSIVRGKLSIRHIFKQLPIGCVLVTTHCSIDAYMGGPLSSLMRDTTTSFPHFLALSRAADVAQAMRLSMKLADVASCLSPSRSLMGMFHGSAAVSSCSLCHSQHTKMTRKRIVEPSREYHHHIRTSKRPFCDVCLATALHNVPFVCDNVILHDDVINGTRRMTCPSSSTAESHPAGTLRAASKSAPPFVAKLQDMPKLVPLLDFDCNSTDGFEDDDDDDDDGESVYSGIDLRSTVRSHVDVYDSSDDNSDVDGSVQEAATPILMDRRRQHMHSFEDSSPCSQLAQLTAKMDDTLRLLRRNKSHVDFCRSHGRVEVL